MSVKISNNAATTIAGSLTTVATSIALAAGSGSKFPTLSVGDWFPLTLVKGTGEREIVKVTARSGDLLTVVRGQEGSSPLTFSAGDKAELRITAAVFDELTSKIAQAQVDAEAADKTDIAMIVMSGNNAAPSRGTWLKCDGAAVSRTTYADLFAKIGSTYGAGNGSTTFNLPDFRGVFPRGLDEGRGIDAGRSLGNTVQGDQNKSHTHGGQAVSAGSDHAHTGTTDVQGWHAHNTTVARELFQRGTNAAYGDEQMEGTSNLASSGAGEHAHNVTVGGGAHAHNLSITADGGAEVRVKNIATLFWIRAA